jgi:hypothetical protein
MKSRCAGSQAHTGGRRSLFSRVHERYGTKIANASSVVRTNRIGASVQHEDDVAFPSLLHTNPSDF